LRGFSIYPHIEAFPPRREEVVRRPQAAAFEKIGAFSGETGTARRPPIINGATTKSGRVNREKNRCPYTDIMPHPFGRRAGGVDRPAVDLGGAGAFKVRKQALFR